ncbi:UDP-N-acetylmuramate--alanine ligase [Peptoniphilus koenoeneniae]|uniref:UDP-N-acetylmuramate--L-alanine ligase n=1 Tax=Peptoniphilus koenoeneniae TaxID=507751 RepID=A0ABU0AUD7_9FIRM|nr:MULTISPECIES: UDP-N-acetylmuramate--L-alanine ligase [Peptoniphilus]ERT57251.1 UDP-N-acetylmuramate--L-alanine ligase [Peptoniphilus sp. BV3C26]MDQ0274872.1 UDP-N-acetylmuramate--alanine ligase [Peptoniphilus koenoeneniae]
MFKFNLNEKKYKHVHFIGIGGISMSGLAEILNKYGYKVTGSDSKQSDTTDKLKSHGIDVIIGQKKENIKGADLIIYTDAISLDNEELAQAIKTKVDLIDRASFLGALMENYKVSIAISGTHGKTTTTSMVAEIIKNLPTEPTIIVGGKLDDINGNVLVGKEEMILTEACEYKANVLKYFPTTALVLNIDEDHLDYFDNIDHIINTFKGYGDNLGKDDKLILNIDDENTRNLLERDNTQIITIAVDRYADYRAKNIEFNDLGYPQYDLYYKDKYIDKVFLSIMGVHNVYNSLGAIAAAHENNISFKEAIDGIHNYHGVHRRLEYKGNYKGALVMDDYAHHPTEIKASLNALRKGCKKNLYCIFQPHTYTRTKLLLDSFSKSFSQTDYTIITDIYAAREKDYGDIHSKTLVDAINNNGNSAFYMETFDEIVKFLQDNLRPNDMVVTMGAGDVYKIGQMLLNSQK